MFSASALPPHDCGIESLTDSPMCASGMIPAADG